MEIHRKKIAQISVPSMELLADKTNDKTAETVATVPNKRVKSKVGSELQIHKVDIK